MAYQIEIRNTDQKDTLFINAGEMDHIVAGLKKNRLNDELLDLLTVLNGKLSVLKVYVIKALRILIHAMIIRPFVWVLSGFRVSVYTHALTDQNFVLVSNHNSHLDILFLYSLIPLNKICITHPVAAQDYFCKHKFLYWLINFLFDPIWLNRRDQQCGKLFIGQVQDHISAGHNIIMFPEGTRGKAGVISTFKTGIGRVAEKFRNIPIIPVYLSGTDKSFPKKCILPKVVKHSVLVGKTLKFYKSHIDTTMVVEQEIRRMESL